MHRVYLIARGGGVRNPSLYITACFKTNQNTKKNSYDCSLSMQSGSQSTFVLPSIFLVVFRLSYVLYIL